MDRQLKKPEGTFPFPLRPDDNPVYAVSKRALDISVSLTVLILFAPFLCLIGLLVWSEDHGPVFFAQARVGRDGREFRFYKFRSMVPNAEALKRKLAHRNEADPRIFKIQNDPRVTRTGRVLRRYSLDELPQFLNVLKGDMSLVGPRPHLPDEIAACKSAGGYPQERLSVPPGLLCLREVTGRSNLSFEEWLESALRYIRQRSMATDIKILIRAIPAALRGEGAY